MSLNISQLGCRHSLKSTGKFKMFAGILFIYLRKEYECTLCGSHYYFVI